MSTNDDITYLSHIRDAIETIEGYLQGVTYEPFTADKMMVDAVVRELEIIAKESRRVQIHLSAEQFAQLDLHTSQPHQADSRARLEFNEDVHITLRPKVITKH